MAYPFSYVEPLLHSWGISQLVLVYNLFYYAAGLGLLVFG